MKRADQSGWEPGKRGKRRGKYPRTRRQLHEKLVAAHAQVQGCKAHALIFLSQHRQVWLRFTPEQQRRAWARMEQHAREHPGFEPDVYTLPYFLPEFGTLPVQVYHKPFLLERDPIHEDIVLPEDHYAMQEWRKVAREYTARFGELPRELRLEE